MPAPVDIPAVKGTDPEGNEIECPASDEEPFAALVFKIVTDPFVGKLAYFRVYSGTLDAGSYVLNATKGKKERVGRILQMHANKRQELNKGYAGDIAAAIGFKFSSSSRKVAPESALPAGSVFVTVNFGILFVIVSVWDFPSSAVTDVYVTT